MSLTAGSSSAATPITSSRASRSVCRPNNRAWPSMFGTVCKSSDSADSGMGRSSSMKAAFGGGFSPSLNCAGLKGSVRHRGDDSSASCNRSTSLTVQTSFSISTRSPSGSGERNMAVASASTASSRPSSSPARSAAYRRKASMQPGLSASQPRSIARLRQITGRIGRLGGQGRQPLGGRLPVAHRGDLHGLVKTVAPRRVFGARRQRRRIARAAAEHRPPGSARRAVPPRDRPCR